MKLVAEKPSTPTISIKELKNKKAGILVCVFENHASIAARVDDDSWQFISLSIDYVQSTLTNNPFPSDYPIGLIERVCGLIEQGYGVNETSYYFFDTLRDFAQAVIDNNWVL